LRIWNQFAHGKNYVWDKSTIDIFPRITEQIQAQVEETREMHKFLQILLERKTTLIENMFAEKDFRLNVHCDNEGETVMATMYKSN